MSLAQHEITRVAVLASGEGSNLQAILDVVHKKHGVEVVCVVSDKLGARALERATEAGVPTAIFPVAEFEDRRARDMAIASHLRDMRTDLVVLAGYMAILSEEFIGAFFGRIINVHPSLLPKYPGLRAIEQAIEAGENHTGVTVHYVDEGVDTGDVIAQEVIGIAPGETAEQVAERIHEIEHQLLPEVIAQIAASRNG
ncbi:MAG: phosphoribosylglycinamide formyltransferase [Thermoleophilaceae bacterium]|nr:phosphoribosylglycinamide formyltransferase [Thermoleophilaceae bacterium]